MDDLHLNKYKIREIKYELNENKTVIFKLKNFNIEDVEIEVTEQNADKTSFSLTDLDSYGRKKDLHDYKPVSCLASENGMQETLEAARKKEWKKAIKDEPTNKADDKCLNGAFQKIDSTSNFDENEKITPKVKKNNG